MRLPLRVPLRARLLLVVLLPTLLLAGSSVWVARRLAEVERPGLMGATPAEGPAPGTLLQDHRSEAATDSLRPLHEQLVTVGTLALLVAVLLGLAFGRGIAESVRHLVRAADEMELGNYQYPLDITRRDELGLLAERFDEMRRREQAHLESLREVARIKGEFIRAASRELRTPISVIRGFYDLMAAGHLGTVTPAQEKALSAIESSLHSLARYAEDATRLAQIEGERLILTIEDHDVASILRKGVGDAVSDARHRELEVTVEAEPDLPTVRVDGMRVAHAVSQLVRNAIRFTHDGGFVDVGAWRDGEELVIRVRDSGVGIPEEKCRQLFDRSAALPDPLPHHASGTLEIRSAGLGVGLVIVRGILEAHGGTITVESQVARGTTFTLRLPLDCSPPQQAAA